MKKVEFLFFIGIALSFSFCNTTKDISSIQKPNIIYILADDLGYGDLGCYGQQIIQTPYLDQLAKEGMRFTQHYSGSTVCAPSRGTLMTGLHTGHAYIRRNGKYQLRPDPKDVTVATYLKNVGYKTAMIGKSSTGGQTKPAQPNQKGFDHFFGYLGHGQAHSYFPDFLHRNGEQIDFPNNGGSKTWRGDTYSHDLFIEEAKQFIEKEKATPFFLFYAAALPHAQVWAPESFEATYKGKFDEKPFGLNKKRHYGETLTPHATTAAMISRLDWEVGQIMQHLEKLGIADNTIILFSSDNGPHNVGGRSPEFFKSSGPFKGIKRDLYEGGIRAPFIIKWPKVIKPGSTSDHISAFWDVLPTLNEIAGAPIPPNIDGISFLPILKGEKAKQKKHNYLYWEFFEKGGKQAVRKGKWKAIRLDTRKNPNGPLELYNLEEDISESKNLAAHFPSIIKEMEELMKAAHSPPEYIPKKRKRK